MELGANLDETRDNSVAWRRGSGDAAAWSPGTVIGRYVLIGRLGAGNMGVVYAAYDPELDRKVALKLVLPVHGGADTGRARLVREAQALAKLSHPNVVAVHDVGTHGEEVWIAMEFVSGQTLGAWAREKPRRWPELLRVLVDAGRGVAAAHAAGLVHRDLKPDNVMIDRDDRVRVMDFGLAHGRLAALDHAGVDTTLPDESALQPEHAALAEPLTQLGATPGTPAYMAPEQWRGQPTDSSTDQFGWSVMAWELLFGERPFRGESGPVLRDAVTTGQRRPPPRGRGVPGWLRRALDRGLAVDPGQRWRSMAALLAALDRGRARLHLRIAGVVALAVAAVAGVAAGVHRWDVARRASACAAAGAEIDEVWNDEARAVVRAAFAATGVANAAATAELAIPWLDQRAAAWKLARVAACEAVEVRGTWDAALSEPALWCLTDKRMELAALLAEFERATPTTLQKAVPAAASLVPAGVCLDEDVLRRLPVPPSDPHAALQAARVDLTQAHSLDLTGELERSLALAIRARDGGAQWRPLMAAALAQEGVTRMKMGTLIEAAEANQRAYFTAAGAGAWAVAAAAASNQIFALGMQGRHAEAILWAEHAALAIALAGDPTGIAEAKRRTYLGLADMQASAYAEALGHMERALPLWEAALSPDHPDIARVLSNLASVYIHTGQHTRALALLTRALEIHEDTLGPGNPDAALVLGNMSVSYLQLGRCAEAEAALQRSLAGYDRSGSSANLNAVGNMCNLADVFIAQGRLDEARALAEQALATYETVLGREHPRLYAALIVLTKLDNAVGAYAAAQATATRILAIVERSLGPEHVYMATTSAHLAEALLGLGMTAEARATAERGLAVGTRVLGADHPDLADLHNRLADIGLASGDWKFAATHAARALALQDGSVDVDPAIAMTSLRLLAELALRAGEADAAADLAERAAALADRVEGRRAAVAATRFTAARALLQRDEPRAVALATAARDGLRAAGPAHAELIAAVDAWLTRRR